jgi:hypothetical protein
LSGWNPTIVDFCVFGTSAGIYLEGRFKQSVEKVKFLNCYAPYKERELLWQPIIESGLLREEGIIVGGDLNFTFSTREVWGDWTRSDPLADHFSSLIQSFGLVDIISSKMAPTWRNGREGTSGISKRLDRFLLEESIIGNHSKIRSRTINSTILDHNLICLQLESSTLKNAPTFKFNNSWINDPEFTSLIKKMWHTMDNWADPSTIQFLCEKLKNLKKVVVLWQRDKKTQLQSELHHIEVKMAEIFEKCPS